MRKCSLMSGVRGPKRAVVIGAGLLLTALVSREVAGETRVSRVVDNLFRLRHGSTFSAAGGGRKGAWRGMEKAASLCSALGFEHFRIEDRSQYQYPSSGAVGTRAGSTVLLVRCQLEADALEWSEREQDRRPEDEHIRLVAEYLPSDSEVEIKVQRAIHDMLELERKERERAEKLANRTPEQVAADEAKEQARRDKEAEKLRRREEKELEKAKKKLGKPP